MTKDNPPNRPSFTLINSGSTPATLIGYHGESFAEEIGKTVIVGDGYKERLVGDVSGAPIIPQGFRVMIMDPFSKDNLERSRRGTVNLYVFAYIKYKDIFKEEHETASLMTYDEGERMFMIVDRPGYNYAT